MPLESPLSTRSCHSRPVALTDGLRTRAAVPGTSYVPSGIGDPHLDHIRLLDAIAATLPLGSVSVEREVGPKGDASSGSILDRLKVRSPIPAP